MQIVHYTLHGDFEQEGNPYFFLTFFFYHGFRDNIVFFSSTSASSLSNNKQILEQEEHQMSVAHPCQEMNLTIIPFFLATQFAIPEIEKWKYGPEINYDLNILTTKTNEGENDPVQMDINGGVGCRVKNEDTLLCRISKMNYRMIDMTNNLDETGIIFVNQNFELGYNENGMNRWNMKNPIDIDNLKLIQNFAAQMTIGVNIRQYMGVSTSFVKKENFTIGECNTAFNISWQEDDRSSLEEEQKESSSEEQDEVKLTLIGVPKKSGNINLIIEKFRNPKRCVNGNYYLSWLTRGNLEKKVISSFSRITVKENESFESFTVTTIKAKFQNSAIIHEFSKVKLKSITEATGPLPTIPNSGTDAENMIFNHLTD
ncbi:PREDICTED: uncharacterized protein LOC107065036 isoform X1 [Polistes dominula]|uniref:Uncharacterized protein LOC107065036 isoform X1 n=2 Tax=Polistes dominula TaxID=743375 RepID=A0ABM1I0S1_POLDO|nr:PREDICTED: uncharacterized protein LOC107065036 isoform X1 [Polistes dominula]